MLNHEYELTVIIRPDLDDSDAVALVSKIEGMIGDNGGTLLLSDDWGPRKLAYAIKKHLKGRYVLFTYAAPAELNRELEGCSSRTCGGGPAARWAT